MGKPLGSLYLVAIPIGNLEDITLRALRILREVVLVVAEDVRQTRKMLTRYQIEKPLLSYYDNEKRPRLNTIIEALLQGDVALVSDAGTPIISDPGSELVQTAISINVPVIAIPGPCAVIAGAIVSGLSVNGFYYLGFLPRLPGDRRKCFNNVRYVGATLVCFEAAHRLEATLLDAWSIFGNRAAAIVCDLTKSSEQVMRGRLRDIAQIDSSQYLRREIVLIIEGYESIS